MCSGNSPRGRYFLFAGLSAVLAFLTYAPSLHAGTITIDSFDYPNPGDVFFTPGAPPWGTGNPTFISRTGFPEGEVIGDKRDIYVEVKGDPTPSSAAGIVGYESVYQEGILKLSTGGEPGTYLIAQYDGMVGDPQDLTDGGTNDRLRLTFDNVDAGDGSELALKVTVVGTSGSAVFTGTVAEAVSSTNRDILFTEFSDPSVFSSVQSIAFAFNDLETPVSNVDFEVDSIEVVPEPSTLVLLFGFGAFMLVAWSRRKR